MAGHSKRANIQHRKKAQDARRGKLFTRLIREIMVVAKAGASHLASNPSLRGTVDKARAQSVPQDAIDRAIMRRAGELGGSVAFMFSSVGVLTYAPGSDEEAIMEAALEAAAQDVVTEEDGLIAAQEELDDVQEAFSNADFPEVLMQ